ncbi:MAG: hypothetical protein KF779_16360 [Hyphomonadaceae bacterium]|nr:hypothetical protein [Hyphomonadaceae bacterium]
MGSHRHRLITRTRSKESEAKSRRDAGKLLRASLVALVAGASNAAAQEADYLPPNVTTSTPTGVALSDGSFIYSNTDISIGPLTLERFHLGGAREASDGLFGRFMSHNFDIYVAPNRRSSIRPGPIKMITTRPVAHLGQSASGVYDQAYPDTSVVLPWTPDSLTDTLTFSSSDLTTGDYQYTAHNGTIYNFTHTVNATPIYSQRVSSILYPTGRTLNFSYNGSDQLRLITDNSGYALVFDYAANGRVSAACGFNLAVTYVTTSTTCAGASLKTSYGYDAQERLTSFTDVMGNVTTFTYMSSGIPQITCIKPPTHATCRIANVYGNASARYQVTQQTLADGTVWNYNPTVNPSRNQDLYLFDDGQQGTVVTDPLTHTQDYRFTGSAPYTFTDALGRVTQYRYSTNWDPDSAQGESSPPQDLHNGKLLESAIFPEGNRYDAVYAGPFRSITQETFTPRPGSAEQPAVLQYQYATCTNLQNDCTQPIRRRDAMGNWTDLDYTAFGSLEMEMLPAPSAGAPRPLRLLTYEQRFAYVKNAGGTLVPAATPQWVISTETQCQTVSGSGNDNPVCDSSARSIVTRYTYTNGTASSLLPSSITTDGGTLEATISRTYTNAGDIASETGPRTDVVQVSYSTYDNMRRRIFEIGPDPDGAGSQPRTIIKHTYSADGNETLIETGYGQQTNGSDFTRTQYRAMTYDGMGRVIRTEVGAP